MSHLARGEALEVHQASAKLGTALIVNSVSLQVPEGRFTGLIGPNGSGKSTLLRSIARILTLEGGTVLVGDDDVSQLPAREMARRMALVEQQATTEVDLDVLDVVLLGRIPHHGRWRGASDADRTIALHHLEKVGLSHVAGRPWDSLSGGEQQRVQLARAFAQEPTVLALDEPTNHLDIAHALELLATVQHIGVTVIAALHDLNLAATFCDEVVVLDHGRVVAAGPPEETFTPDLLRRVYGVEASVELNPITRRPAITYYPPLVPH
jgi:iron complex transport system ATP-binding protein